MRPKPSKCTYGSPVTTSQAWSTRCRAVSANSASASCAWAPARIWWATDGGQLFELVARLLVPVSVDVDAVLDSIGSLATKLGIAGNVEDLTGDEATG